MNQKRQYKQYPQEFKEEAVALVNDQGYSGPEAANALGIRSNLLYCYSLVKGYILLCVNGL